MHACTLHIQELREKSSQLTDEVEHLTKINSELKKLLKQDPYGGATRHEEAQVCLCPL